MKRFLASWVNRTIAGIVLATFFSDCSHELSTAVLPLYLATLGHGPAALAVIEGVADFLVSLSKLAGGLLGQAVRRKQPLVAAGYLITAGATGALGLVTSVTGLVTLRSVAWISRGYRGPLRDSLLSDAVERTHYGRAFGLERSGDMLGAVVGPLAAAFRPLCSCGLGSSFARCCFLRSFPDCWRRRRFCFSSGRKLPTSPSNLRPQSRTRLRRLRGPSRGFRESFSCFWAASFALAWAIFPDPF